MTDYEPDYVYMIPLNVDSKEEYFEKIDSLPSKFRGAFMTDEDKDNSIDFQIYDPDNNLIYSNSTNTCIFNVEANKIGRYRILFNNKYANSVLKVTFTMRHGQNSFLKKDDLNISNQKLESLNNFIERFDLEFKFNRNIHNDRYKSKNF